MVNTVTLNDIPSAPSSFPAVVGLSQLAAPALGISIVAQGLSHWMTGFPFLLQSGSDDKGVSDWAKSYGKLSTNSEVLAVVGSIVAGVTGASELPFGSFARFYFIAGSLSSAVYLLFTPYFRYKLNLISKFGVPTAPDQGYGEKPKKHVKHFLIAHLVSGLVAGVSAGCYWYGLYNAINHR